MTAARFRPPAPTPRDKPLSTLALLGALARDPLLIWHRVHYELPVVAADTAIGPTAVVSDPDGIRRVLVDNFANYRKDDVQRSMLGANRDGGVGLLLAEGDAWRRQRRALAGLFAPRAVAAFAPAMAAAAATTADAWTRRRAGRTVEIGHDMALFTLDVLERTILSDGLADAPGRFADEMTRFFKVYGRADPADLLGLPKWAPRLTRLGGGGSLQFFEGAISRILERRRARPISEWPRDLLTMLIEARDPESGEGLSEPDIRANVMTFVAAGHETTANALTWTLYLLSQDDEARERAESEVDALGEEDLRDPAKLATLHWTRACLDEAMRLYPPAATLSRQAIGPDEVAGVRIRPGARVLVSPWLVHRHKLNWRDPDLFDPSRFLPENRDSIPRFAYLPFGAGPRVCIGMGFAIQEAMIALATWLRGFRFELAPGHSVMPRQRLTLRPAGGMPMVIKSRRDS